MSNEQRLTVRLVDMWEQLACEFPPPPYAKWNSTKISDIWHNCMALSVDPSPRPDAPKSLHTLFVGEKLKTIIPHVQTGTNYQTHSFTPDMKKLFTPLPQVLTTQSKAAGDGTFVSKNNKIVKYRCCFLPFSEAQKYIEGRDNVHYVVAGFSWMQM